MRKFLWRRAFPSLMLVTAFVLLYEATVSDSRYASRQAELLKGNLKPIPGTRLQFKATAYCKGHTTASGVAVRSGVAAADDDLLPVGSVIQADFESNQYDGVAANSGSDMFKDLFPVEVAMFGINHQPIEP